MKILFTRYLETKALAKRTYLSKEMCIRVVPNPIRKEVQEDGERLRFWGKVSEVSELEGWFLRVVTLCDEKIIHDAFPDRRFKP